MIMIKMIKMIKIKIMNNSNLRGLLAPNDVDDALRFHIIQ